MESLDLPTLTINVVKYFFEKAFEPLKELANYQIDKVNINEICKEAYNNLSNLDQVRTINEFDKAVSLYSFYVPPQVTSLDSNETSKKTFLVENLSDFSGTKKILISGIVGQGKSILMRNLAIQESFKGERLPIFVELKDLEDNESLEKFMRKSISSILQSENEKITNYLLEEGKVILFFDGFDEVKTENMGKIVKDFEKIERKFKKLNFVVSSRPEDTIDKSTVFSKFLINKLDLDGQIKIIEKLTDEKLIKENLIKNLKESNKDIKGVLVTPLMVNFYFYLYKTEQITGTHIALFYNKLFDLTLRKHDGTKLTYKRSYITGLTPEKIEEAFECICFLSCKQKTFFFAEYDFLDIVKKTIKFQNLKCSPNDLIKDFTTGICFIVREGQSYAFLHTSIPEFFAAKFLLRNINVNGVLKEVFENYDNYINVIKYMQEVNEKEFYISFLKPILEESIEFFKSKEILNKIYISLKLYDKKKSYGNYIYIITICDSSVHRYIASDFKDFIKPFMKDEINKKFIRGKKIKYEFFWKKSSKSSSEKESEVIQSENYFLHERIDSDGVELSIPSTSSTNRKALDLRIEKDEFRAIGEKYSQRAKNIENGVTLYIMRLVAWKEKIKGYETSSIEDLFS